MVCESFQLSFTFVASQPTKSQSEAKTKQFGNWFLDWMAHTQVQTYIHYILLHKTCEGASAEITWLHNYVQGISETAPGRQERAGSILALAVSKQSSALFCCALDMQIMFLFCLCWPWSFARVASPATFILYVAKKNCLNQQSWISDSTMSWPLKNFTQEYDNITTHTMSQMHMYFR
jgi:hypothetical protein